MCNVVTVAAGVLITINIGPFLPYFSLSPVKPEQIFFPRELYSLHRRHHRRVLFLYYLCAQKQTIGVIAIPIQQ